MVEIIFLGTGGAVASSERDNTCLLVKTNKDLILIDLAGSPVKKLTQINIDFKKISLLFFTHAHPDHLYGIISLLHSQYQLKNKLHIYAHLKVIKLINRLRRTFKLEDTNKYPRLVYHKIKASPCPFYESNEVKVSSFKVRHSPESLGFKFFFKKIKKSCLYSADTAMSFSLMKEAKACDYLIHDCFSPQRYFKKYPQLNKMHTSSLSLGKIAKRSQVKILIPIHFASEVKYPLSEVIQEIKKNFSGKLIIPKDLMSLKLN